MVFDNDPLSIVLLQPISTLLPIITDPICGYLILTFLVGKNPKPFLPIIAPSKILVLLPITLHLIITLFPILVLSPITTLFSIIVLCPIKQFFPILTFFPKRTFCPYFKFLN